ncbi:3-isopropylmalate dehydratase small subunit (plasmid) [Bacillus sp. 31A1R]|uniref:3-isopropylmalate dehydratase small subunit n=1 Tax=Robertmurraya mangrovi TaxID=3098077 RepID=A0ABU5IUK1_9BACI|nr:3-isopropylmalate dehydratase small subunit [Bacillus sp. 31A1R]MDZ5470776.1 3-isopropylmalate dehydratase small subunit [Bacillus sp. 31A1R]
MAEFKQLKGKAVVLNRANVDTDQIIPKQFLKRIERTGFGQFLFYDWRYLPNGELNREFELNRPDNIGGTILITNENFGCGSSREHAPWALLDYGFKVIISPSFADIFYQNCLKNGMLPIQLTEGEIQYLLKKGEEQSFSLEVNLEEQSINDESGFVANFPIHTHWKTLLMNGWDEIEITLQLEDKIAAFEQLA